MLSTVKSIKLIPIVLQMYAKQYMTKIKTLREFLFMIQVLKRLCQSNSD